MARYIKIDAEGTGIFDREIMRAIHELVLHTLEGQESPTMQWMCSELEIHPQRASRLVRRLGIRERFR
jgi:hypothetical protein